METSIKYYQVSVSSDPGIIGVTNGVYQVELDDKAIDKKDDTFKEFVKWFDYKNHSFWNNQDEVKLLKRPTIKGKMLKKAKITDIMGYASEYFNLHNVYSRKFIDIISTFNLGESSFFKFEIKDVREEYYFMYLKTITTSEVIFNKSTIYTGHKMMNNIKYYPVSDYTDFLNLLETVPLVTYEKIAISKEYYGRDIISIQATAGNFYSEKLIDFLLDCGITGLQIKYNNSVQLDFV